MPKTKPTAPTGRNYDDEMAEDECAKRHPLRGVSPSKRPPPGCEIRIVSAETLLGPGFNMDHDPAMLRHRCLL